MLPLNRSLPSSLCEDNEGVGKKGDPGAKVLDLGDFVSLHILH